MVSYPISLPSQGVQGIVIRKAEAGGMTQSPYTGAQEVYAYPGQWWEADVTLCPANLQAAGAIEGFIGLLRGTYGTFLMGDPMRPAPLGTGGGTPLVNGAQSSGAGTLNVKGCPLSTTKWLAAGDLIQLGSLAGAHLHQVLADANSDGSGHTTLTLWPNLRADVADGDAVTITNCMGLFRLAQSKQAISRRPGPFTDYSFTAIEAI
jgi:hypothetical protein